MQEAFVYCWTDHITNKLYVGSHKGSPDDGYICSSKYFNEEYNKRPQDFTRQIVASGEAKLMRSFEATLLKAVNARDDLGFYNLHNGDGEFTTAGTHLTDAHKKKISARVKGENHPLFGVPMSEETKQKISKANTGRKASPDTKKKLSLAVKNRVYTEEQKKKRSEISRLNALGNQNMLGKKQSQACKDKLSELRKGKNNPMYGTISPNRGVLMSDEAKQKLSKTRKDKFAKTIAHVLADKDKLKHKHEKRGFSLSALGREYGISYQIIQNIINGYYD